MSTENRSSATPLALGAIICVVTGILASLYVVTGLPQSTQMWLTGIFIATVVFHTVVNWKQFT